MDIVPARIRTACNAAPVGVYVGILFCILAAIGFSSKAIFIKLAYAQAPTLDPVTLMTLRMLLSLPFFVAAMLWSSSRATTTRLGRKDYFHIALLGVLGYYLASLLDFTGLQYISASLERLILFLYPTLLVGLIWLQTGRPIVVRERWALLLSYAGIALAVSQNLGQQHLNTFLGVALVFASALAYALFLLGSQSVIRRIGSVRFTAYTMGVSCVVTCIHFMWVHPVNDLQIATEVYGLAMAMAIFSTVLPAFLMNAGIARIGSPRAAIVGSIGPIVTLYLAALVLGESIEPLQVLATLIVIAGVWFARH